MARGVRVGPALARLCTQSHKSEGSSDSVCAHEAPAGAVHMNVLHPLRPYAPHGHLICMGLHERHANDVHVPCTHSFDVSQFTMAGDL